jgi:hypothetical protein
MPYFLMSYQGVSLLIFQLRNAIYEMFVDHGVVEEFGVFLTLFEPLNPRFLSPKDFLLLVYFFQFPLDDIILLLFCNYVACLYNFFLKVL